MPKSKVDVFAIPGDLQDVGRRIWSIDTARDRLARLEEQCAHDIEKLSEHPQAKNLRMARRRAQAMRQRLDSVAMVLKDAIAEIVEIEEILDRVLRARKRPHRPRS